MAWTVSGFRLYRANMSLLGMLTIVLLVTFTLMLRLSIVGVILITAAQPMINLAIANCCRGIERNGHRVAVAELLAGLQTRRVELFKLGGLQLLGSTLVMLAMYLLDIKPDPAKPEQLPKLFAEVVLLSSPMLMAFWFAPLLCGWHGQPPLKALFFSLIATMRNWRALFVYVLTLAAITILPSLLADFATQISEPFGRALSTAAGVLMMVVVLPVVLTGAYVSYRDIFTSDDGTT